MPAADAIAALRAAGRCVTKTTRADAARRYGCQTALYVIDGRGVNLGRLRELAAELTAPIAPELTAPDAVTAQLCRKFPISTPATYQPAIDRLQARGAALTPAAVLRELGRPAAVLPGEAPRPATPKPEAPEPVLPHLPPVAFAPAVQAVADRPAPTGEGLAGQPWDPGTPEARARVALQGERAGILWPIARALTGEGLTLPASWATDGPALAGELPVSQALARLPLGAIATAAAALAALPPVTLAQDAALSLCHTGAVPGRPYL